MNQPNTLPAHKPTATLTAAQNFIDIVACSGYRAYRSDREAFGRTLSAEVSDAQLGDAIRSALSSSRQIDFSEVKTFFDPALIKRLYDAWVDLMKSSYGYKSRRALHQALRSCRCEIDGSMIRLVPWRREGAEGYVGFGTPEVDVVVALNVSDAELGAAARLALSRCE
jgi:hypothetical protein